MNYDFAALCGWMGEELLQEFDLGIEQLDLVEFGEVIAPQTFLRKNCSARMVLGTIKAAMITKIVVEMPKAPLAVARRRKTSRLRWRSFSIFGVGNLSLGGFRQSSLWSHHFPLSFAIHVEPRAVVADGQVFKVETL